MEALNKESEFAAPVLTWSDLREKSTVNVCKELMNHEDVLLKLETKIINNGKGMHVHPLTGFARSWKQCCMVPSFICYLKKHFTFTVRFFIFIYALTILYYNYNWPRQMTRGWVLLLLNIKLHVKGFNKLIERLRFTFTAYGKRQKSVENFSE